MALGDARYRRLVDPATRALITQNELGDPEWLIPGTEAPSFYPDALREFIDYAAERMRANGLVEQADQVAMSDAHEDQPAREAGNGSRRRSG